MQGRGSSRTGLGSTELVGWIEISGLSCLRLLCVDMFIGKGMYIDT